MAKLTIKITHTGEEFEIEDVDLSKLTPRQMIDEMIIQGFLPAESIGPYGIVDKNGLIVDGEDLCSTFAKLGFADGDTIEIVAITLGGRDNLYHPLNKAKIDVKTTWDGAGFELEDVDLKQITNRDLIQQMIDAGVMAPESQIPRSADNTPTVYSLIDKAGVKVEPDEVKTLAELGFTDGNTVRIIMRGGGGGDSSVIYQSNSISDFSYESIPIGPSLEEKAQQLADEKIAMSRLEQVRNEEDRCRAHIDRIWHRIEEQKHSDSYYMMTRGELPSEEIRIYSCSKIFDSVDKMQDLLNSRLSQLQNSKSLFDRLRGENELQMIKELLKLVESLKIEQKEMMQKIEALFQAKMHEAGHLLSSNGIRASKESVYFLESYLSEYEKELQDLIDRRRCVEIELDRKQKERETNEVYSSIFAPAEVKRKSHLQVQMYLHLYEETEEVKSLAQESDKNAERRDYIPLQCKLKKGDKVDVQLNIYGVSLLMSDKKCVVWQGSFTKCSFDYFVPKDIDVDELSCVAMLTVNGVPVGEMRFITRIVDAPRQLNPEIIAHKYNKVFISYSHQDESKVKFLHEGLELGSVPHFFDRSYLKPGDVFPQKIQDYINSADLFILCWSENASKSEYVQKERMQALERAYPQVQPEQTAKLRIYPMSIEPRAELPSDMKNYYHFGEI